MRAKGVQGGSGSGFTASKLSSLFLVDSILIKYHTQWDDIILRCIDLMLKAWSPSMGPQPWDPYIPVIYPICTLKGP